MRRSLLRSLIAALSLAAAAATPGITAPASAASPAPGAPRQALAAPSAIQASRFAGYGVEDVCPPRADGGWQCFAKRLVRLPGATRFAPLQPALSPQNLQAAYQLDSSKGAGQTVAVIEGFRYASAGDDLAAYRNQYGLGACTVANGCFGELPQAGQSTLPGTDVSDPSGSAVETMLDIEMVSAICPNCRIRVVEAKDLSDTNVLLAVDAAVAAGANEISLSIGSAFEPPAAREQAFDRAHFAHLQRIAVTVAAGDSGYGVSYPAASPYVTSVGGTTLTQVPSGTRQWTEAVWNQSGGGCSFGETRASYQPPVCGGQRSMNDVAAVADPATGVSVYLSCTGVAPPPGARQCQSGFQPVGGTSASAPIWAGVYALGGGEGYANGAAPLYQNPKTTDIVAGSNGACVTQLSCNAAPGFDGPTGLGVPNGASVPAPRPPSGYWLVASDGGIFPFGGADGYGSTGNLRLNQPIVGMAVTPTHQGYWLVAADGGIFPFGDAPGWGSTGNIRLNKPIVGMATAPGGVCGLPVCGYWLVASDGGIFPFGPSAGGYGSTGNLHLNQPIVGMAATPDGAGYWLVASDGGIFPFGDAPGYGSTGNIHLNKPIVGMAAAAQGYWLVASDGGIFPFGPNAPGYGSTGNIALNQPIVGMAATAHGAGYWLVASDGGIFPFGDAPGYGSTGDIQLNKPMVGIGAY